MTALDISISLRSTNSIVLLREWSTSLQGAAHLASQAALGSQVTPTLHGGQTSRPILQNGGTARNGLQEIGLMSIKSGMPFTTASGTIGSMLHRI